MKHSFAEKINQSSHFLTNLGRSNSIIQMKNKKRLGNPQTEKVPLFRKREKHFDEIL